MLHNHTVLVSVESVWLVFMGTLVPQTKAQKGQVNSQVTTGFEVYHPYLGQITLALGIALRSETVATSNIDEVVLRGQPLVP